MWGVFQADGHPEMQIRGIRGYRDHEYGQFLLDTRKYGVLVCKTFIIIIIIIIINFFFKFNFFFRPLAQGKRLVNSKLVDWLKWRF